MLKKAETEALSFDKLRMRPSDINGLDLMGSLSRFDGLTVRPWAATFFSNLLFGSEGPPRGEERTNNEAAKLSQPLKVEMEGPNKTHSAAPYEKSSRLKHARGTITRT